MSGGRRAFASALLVGSFLLGAAALAYAQPLPGPGGGKVFLPWVVKGYRLELVGQVLDFAGWLGVGSLRGQVTGFQWAKVIPPSPLFLRGATAQGRFAILFMRITNLGDEPTAVSRDSFRLIDAGGRRFHMAELEVQWAAEAYFRRSIVYTDIPPSRSEAQVFVFDVAPDATGLVLVLGGEEGNEPL